jgi:hypothetical protein
MALNDAEIATVKGMLVRGDRQHDIAATSASMAGALARSAPERAAAISQQQ